MVARKRLLAAFPLGVAACLLERLFLKLAFRHIAQHGGDLATTLRACFRSWLLERTAAHLDPDKLRRSANGVSHVAAHAELHRPAFAECCRVPKRAEISRPISNVDPAEQSVAAQIGN